MSNGDGMSFKNLFSSISWGNIVSIVIVSLFFPAMISLFSQKSDISKTIFTEDYKKIRLQSALCMDLHQKYLDSEKLLLGANHHFYKITRELVSIHKSGKNTVNDDFIRMFEAFYKTKKDAEKETKRIFNDVNTCYSKNVYELENLAVSLGLLEKYEEILDKYEKPENESCKNSCLEMREKLAKLDADVKERQNQLNDYNIEELVNNIISMWSGGISEKDFIKKIEEMPVDKLEEVTVAKLKHEAEFLEFQKMKQREIWSLFSKEMQSRFNQGFIRYFIQNLF
ncbi:hypothetical protein [Neisseria dentiae]|uniref:hypothetical protein n=1 Tax=Neisseria dentiae TaxID=194197 RepID=UPI0035A0E78A